MRKLYTKKLECLAKEIYKFLHGLSLPIMNDIFEARGNIYNLNIILLYLPKNCEIWKTSKEKSEN